MNYMLGLLVIAVVLLIASLVGVGVVFEGRDRVGYAAQLRAVPETNCADVYADEPTEIRGTVEPHPDADLLEAPFSDGGCVYREWEVLERRGAGRHRRWSTLDGETDAVPFVINDGTGTVSVHLPEAHDALVDRARNPTQSTSAGDSDPVKSFLEERNISVPSGSWLTRRRRKYVQHLIEPGDTVYALGYATQTAEPRAPYRFELGPFPDEDDSGYRFLVSDFSPRRLLLGYLTGPVMMIYGLILALAPIGFLLNMFLVDFYGTAFVFLTVGAIAVGIGYLFLDDAIVWLRSRSHRLNSSHNRA